MTALTATPSAANHATVCSRNATALAADVGQEFRVGDARAIVDGHVEIFPAPPGLTISTAPLVGHKPAATPALADAPELLDVQVQEFSGMRPFVAHDRRARHERRQTPEP
jgi:hypothetical protein